MSHPLLSIHVNGEARSVPAEASVADLIEALGAASRQVGSIAIYPALAIAGFCIFSRVVIGQWFAGGFFGPILLTPGANQGPLLGIFITGPIGFAVGGILGAIFGP